MLCTKMVTEGHRLSEEAFEWLLGEIESKFFQVTSIFIQIVLDPNPNEFFYRNGWNGGRFGHPIYFHRKSIDARAGSVIARNFSVKTQGSVLDSVI